MSKFLSLVEENTPGNEMKESLADKFHRFAERVSALEEGRDIDVDELLLELNGLNEELTTLGGVPEVEDYESPAKMAARNNKMDQDSKNLDKAGKALQAAQSIKSQDNPARPSRGVKKIDASVNKLGKAVAKSIDRVTQSLR